MNSLKFVDFVGLIEYILVGGGGESGDRKDPMRIFRRKLIKNKPNVQADDISYHTWGDFSGIKQSVEEALREERGSVMSKSWNREKGNLKCMGSVKLIGHSWGGSTAYSVAHRIDRSKVGMVQFQLITIDPVSHIFELPKQTSRPAAVDSWHNIHKEPLWSDVVPNIPIIGHVIRGIAAAVETIARGDKGWNEFITTWGGRWGAVSGAFNTKVENLNHIDAWGMYERWQDKTIGSLPNPSK